MQRRTYEQAIFGAVEGAVLTCTDTNKAAGKDMMNRLMLLIDLMKADGGDLQWHIGAMQDTHFVKHV